MPAHQSRVLRRRVTIEGNNLIMRAPPRISQKDITMPYIRRLAAALKRSNEISRKDSTRMMRAGLTALLFWGVVIASFLVTPLPSVARELSLLVPGGTSMSDDSTSAPPTSGVSTTRYEPTRSAAGVSVAAHPAETSRRSTVNSNAVPVFACVPQVANFVLEANWARLRCQLPHRASLEHAPFDDP